MDHEPPVLTAQLNKKRFFSAVLAVFIIYALATSYVQILVFGGIWELGFAIGDLLWASVFVFLLIKTGSTASLKASVWFGVMIGLLFCCPIALGFSPLTAITNTDPDLSDWLIEGVIPSQKALYWSILTIVKIAACGIAVRVVYRPA